jgi:tetratricopeptide (TPR) repeat protein
LAVNYQNLGECLRITDRPQQAEEPFRKALTIYEKLAADHPHLGAPQRDIAGALHNLAMVLQARGELSQARQLLNRAIVYQQRVLKANSQDPHARLLLRNHYAVLTQILLGQGAHADGARAAIDMARARPDDPVDSYNAACFLALCMPLAEKDARLAGEKRLEVAGAYATQAMQFLRVAIQKGWKNAAHMKTDPDLNTLRDREDFKKLLADLKDGKVKKVK